MHVLVTGGAGYLGSILCEHLLDAGHTVTVLDDLSCGRGALFHLCANPGFEFVRGDARDERTLRDALAKADAIIPLAAVVGAPACDRDPERAQSVNFGAIRTLDKLRSKAQLVVYPTTNSGYGTKSTVAFCTEETSLQPISLYGRTKVDAEQLLLASTNAVTLRLATVFGMSPRPRLDLLVNHFTWAAVTDRYLVLFEKHFRRNFIHIRDVADCFLHCLKNGERMTGRAFNAGLETANLTKEELARKVQEHVPGFYVHHAEIGTDPDKRDYLVSNARLKSAGFEAQRSLDEGIRELLKGYRMIAGAGEMRNA